MDNQLLMDMVYVGCGVIFGLIVRKLVVTYCKRPWVGLTDEEVRDLWSWAMTAEAERTANTQQHAFARAIEAELKEKNHGG